MRVTITVQKGDTEDTFTSEEESIETFQGDAIGPDLLNLIQKVADRAKRAHMDAP